MRARQRHLNARHAGAMFVLDARFIDQSDNTAVSTWSDRSGNGYDVSQTTGANQPTLQTQEQGGSSIVRFDGSNDFLQRSDTGFPTGDLTIVGCHKQNTTLSNFTGAMVFHYGAASIGSAVFYFYRTDANMPNSSFGISQYGDAVGIQNSTGSFIVGSIYRSGTSYYVRRNGGSAATKTMTTNTSLYGTNGFRVGQGNPGVAGSFLNGDIGSVIVFASNLSDSLRRRFELQFGLTWKIACS